MQAARFTIETYVEQFFDGFSRGEDWNGWARPYFTFEQAQQIIEAHRSRGWKAWYDEKEDSFAFDFSHDGLDEVDVFPPVELDSRKLYPVGAGCWVWEEVTEEVNA